MRSFLRWANSLIYVVQATHALHCGDLDKVIVKYSRAIEISPEDLDYYHARGRAYRSKGERGRAIADFSTAIDLNPNDDYAHMMRGVIYREKGFVAQAMMDFTEVIELVNDYAPPYVFRAACHAEKKDYGAAMADLEEALRLEPWNEDALKLKVRCTTKMEQEPALVEK